MTTHGPHRRRLPETRPGLTHHGKCGALDFYVTVNFYADCEPGEVFVKVAKQGSEVAGWVDGWAVTTSIALQYGVPWPVLRDKALWTRFGGYGDLRSPSLLHAIAAAISRIVGDHAGEPPGPEEEQPTQ